MEEAATEIETEVVDLEATAAVVWEGEVVAVWDEGGRGEGVDLTEVKEEVGE